MKYAVVLLLLVACSGVRCPDGFVVAEVGNSPACISAVSYCVSDEQCTSARFDCSRPCAHLPVNVLFSAVAREKESSCDRLAIRCKQVPFVDNRCVSNQCVSVARAADELIPQPVYREVVSGKIVCYEKQGFDSVLRLNVLNNASVPLRQLEARVNLSLRNGSTVLAEVSLLNESLPGGSSVEVKQYIQDAVPLEVFIFAVRPVEGNGVLVGVKNKDDVVRAVVLLCEAKGEGG